MWARIFLNGDVIVRTGLLNPLDIPHHMRVDEESEYREGIILDRPSKPGKGSLVNCGMWKVAFFIHVF